MSKALMGYVGQPPAYMILRELNALKARVAELERALALAEQPWPDERQGFSLLKGAPAQRGSLFLCPSPGRH